MANFMKRKYGEQKEIEHKSYTISLFFVIGKSSHEDVHSFLNKEAQEYNDILITDNKEGYKNLPLKTLALLNYFIDHCQSASYLLKMDDDVFLSASLLAKTLDELPNSFTLGGRLTSMEAPDRTKGYKYFVSKKVFPDSHYPPYLSGKNKCFLMK